MELPHLSLDEISKFLDISRNKGARVISRMGKLSKYFDAVMNSEVGRELLRDDVTRFEELLEKIANENASPQDLAEYRYLKNVRIPRIIDKVTQYIKDVQGIKKVTNAG